MIRRVFRRKSNGASSGVSLFGLVPLVALVSSACEKDQVYVVRVDTVPTVRDISAWKYHASHGGPFWAMGVSHGVMYASSGADKKRDDSYPNHRKADALIMRTPADKLVRWIRHIHGTTGAGSGSARDRNNGLPSWIPGCSVQLTSCISMICNIWTEQYVSECLLIRDAKTCTSCPAGSACYLGCRGLIRNRCLICIMQLWWLERYEDMVSTVAIKVKNKHDIKRQKGKKAKKTEK